MAAKNYVVSLILEAKDKNVKMTLSETGQDVKELAADTEAASSRMQRALTGAGIAAAFGAAIPIMAKSIDMYSQATSALSGLRSAVRFAGEDWSRARQKLEEFTDDGLVPFAQASASLKNLLAGGYGLDEALDVLRVMKDYAAYGRQGQLSMGEAIERTTQGLKAELSSLSDNAGWTTNLSQAHKAYAAELDKGVASLTKAERIQATYNQIMRDGVAVQGDAAQASEELVGKMAQQEAGTRELYEAIGAGLAPVYSELLGVLGPVVEGLTDFAKANPEVTATLLGGAGLVAVVAMLAAALALLGGPGAIVAGVVAGLVVLAGGITKLVTVLKPSTSALEKTAVAAGENAVKMRALRREYVDLQGKPGKSAEEHGRLKDVMEEIAGIVPEAVEAFDAEGRALGLNLEAIESYIQAQEILRQTHIGKLEERRAELLEKSAKAQDDLRMATQTYNAMVVSGTDVLRQYIPELESQEHGMREDQKETARAGKTKQDYVVAIVVAKNELEKENKALAEVDEALRRLKGSTDDAGDAAEDAADDVGDLGDEIEKTGVKAESTADGIMRLARGMAELHGIETGPAPGQSIWDWMLEEYEDYLEQRAEDHQDFLDGQEEREREAEERRREALNAYRQSLKGKLDTMLQDWTDYSDAVVGMVDSTASFFAQAWHTIATGGEDTTEKLKQLWSNFFSWLVQQIMEIIVRWFFAQVLNFILPGLGSAASIAAPDILGESTGYGYAQSGGKIAGSIPGLDRVPILGQAGESILSVDLTRRMERMVGAWESGTAHARIAGPEPGEVREVREGDTFIFHVSAIDAASVRRSLRDGPLGRELQAAVRSRRLTLELE